MLDANGLKMLNDTYGYEAGDVLIKRIAETLAEVELDAYHNQGDEFICRGASFRELNQKLAKTHTVMANNPFVVRGMDDLVKSIPGAPFCFGIGTNLKEAESSLKHQKELRLTTKDSLFKIE